MANKGEISADKQRVTVILTKDLTERIDTYACKMGISRTSACSVLLSTALDNMQALEDINRLATLCGSDGKPLLT